MTEERRQQINQERIATLVPELQAICIEGIDKLQSGGFYPYIVEALRTQQYQDALYAQGRESLDEVNRLRGLADKDPITEEENKRPVTWTKHSRHLSGRAFDIVNVNNGEIDWDDKNFIGISVIIYESLGLVSGSRWAPEDNDHFELNNT